MPVLLVAVLYRAFWGGAPVAVKLVECWHGSQAAADALREAALSESFDHPSVVKVCRGCVDVVDVVEGGGWGWVQGFRVWAGVQRS